MEQLTHSDGTHGPITTFHAKDSDTLISANESGSELSTAVLQHKAMVFLPYFVIRNQYKGIRVLLF